MALDGAAGRPDETLIFSEAMPCGGRVCAVPVSVQVAPEHVVRSCAGSGASREHPSREVERLQLESEVAYDCVDRLAATPDCAACLCTFSVAVP